MTTMLLKHSHDKNDEFMKLTSFWAEKLNRLDADRQLEFIRTVFLYIENALNLTQEDLTPIFTEVSTNVNDIAMTIADRIREEESQLTFERTTFNYVKGLWEQGFKADVIATAFKLPLQKVEEIIQKIKVSSN
jgi:predicted transcriptional regulator